MKQTKSNILSAALSAVRQTTIKAVAVIALAGFTTSCNDWLDVLPNNEQVADKYWQSKEEVESVIASGYYYLRSSVPTLLKWGELRGGTLYSTAADDTKLQDFNLTPDYKLCDYSTIYKVINMANSVLEYAPSVRNNDDTYYEAIMLSHLCEAYFLRSYCYLTLLKNYGEVPLVTKSYADDTQSFDMAKSTEQEIIAQIRSDVETALATGAAKGTYETEWQTKGRVTKWALYALGADVCLWAEDYNKCMEYCDLLMNASDTFRPVFMSLTADWYSIFYPGNSNESIFELNWDYNTAQETNNFASLVNNLGRLRLTNNATELVREETQALLDNGFVDDARMGRMLLSTVIPSSGNLADWKTTQYYYIWKYYGTDIQTTDGGARLHQDANFIIYRMAEIILMKAQALVMTGNYKEAVRQINRIRTRAGLPLYQDIDTESADADALIAQLDELSLLQEILSQKQMEFIAEGKRWYDVFWLGRISGKKYNEQAVTLVIEGNQTTNMQWIMSALQDDGAWYMPIPQSDIEHNKLLEQNPYYQTTK